MRDDVMTIPRLMAFTTLLLVNRDWNSANFRLTLKDIWRAMYWGIIPVALWVFYFSCGYGQAFTPYKIAAGCFASLVVGLLEEYAFRGPLLSALRGRTSVVATTALTAALFTIYHIQAQPFTHWGAIFLMGVIFANLRFRGLSVIGLTLIHWIIDALYFCFTDRTPDPFGFVWVAFQVGLLVYAVVTLPRPGVTGINHGPLHV